MSPMARPWRRYPGLGGGAALRAAEVPVRASGVEPVIHGLSRARGKARGGREALRVLPQKHPRHALRRMPGKGHARRIRGHGGRPRIGGPRAREERRRPADNEGSQRRHGAGVPLADQPDDRPARLVPDRMSGKNPDTPELNVPGIERAMPERPEGREGAIPSIMRSAPLD